LLPEKLAIDGTVRPEERRRGLFTVNVYTATVDVVAEFQTNAVRDLLADGRWMDWPSAHVDLGITDARSIEGTTIEVDGQPLEWTDAPRPPPDSHQPSLKPSVLAEREPVTVRFRIAFAGSGWLGFAPLGKRTEVTLVSAWPSPSFDGRYLPVSKTVNKDGFQA